MHEYKDTWVSVVGEEGVVVQERTYQLGRLNCCNGN